MNADGVILSAGYSERAREFKPALDLCGKALLLRTVESMSKFCEHIIVIGGHEFEELRSIVKDIPGVNVIRNRHVERGMFSSVRLGVEQVSAGRFFVLPGDQPAVQRSTFETMLEHDAEIVIPRYNGKKGHPVLFRENCKSEILNLPDTEILRNYIHSKQNVMILDVDDPGIGMDVDTPEDYERMKIYYKKTFCE